MGEYPQIDKKKIVQEIINQIKLGGYPNVIGLLFTEEEGNEIKKAVEERKKGIDYFNQCISIRIVNKV